MKTWMIVTTLAASSLVASDPTPKTGIVNFATCASDSKLGKQEQASFETLKKQMNTLVEDTEKQLHEISNKLQDKDYLDGLSPEAEKELNVKMQTLSEELNRYQQQFYQVMQQANYKMFQSIAGGINTAAENLAKSKGLNMIVNKDVCFFYLPSLDITADVIKEMDKGFDKTAEKAALPTPEVKK